MYLAEMLMNVLGVYTCFQSDEGILNRNCVILRQQPDENSYKFCDMVL